MMVFPGWKQYAAGMSSAVGSLSFGASVGWSGPVEFRYKEGKSGYDFIPNGDEWGWVSSLLTLGAAVICIPAGVLIGLFGRKMTMLVMFIPYMIGWALIGFALNVKMVILGRFIIGACGGSFCVTTPMYNTEVAEIQHRGMMGCFFQLFLVHGILYGYIAGAAPDVKMVSLLCAILPIIFVITFIWMPESPVYLMQKGKTEKAEKALKFLRGKDTDNTAELNQLAEESKREKVRITDALFRKATIKGLFLAICLMAFQQFTGINAVVFYSNHIFESANTEISSSLCTILLGIIMITSSLMAFFLIDRIGRKMILLIGSAVMCASLLLLAGFYQWLQSNNVGWIGILSICTYVLAFSGGLGPVPFLLIAELFSEDAKAVAGAIACTLNWLLAFCVTKLFPLCVHEFGEAVCFLFFSIMSLLAFVFVLFLVPETKGRTIKEIQEILGG
ncbi:facilitated trehalose transporter Tret1-like [Drosophila tropicalis]|uniref:facilitated trehalose transporter Tret1-like n=1 Tax=Drosophila tropicalis TaxID=46794 RepID=UPI0035ABD61B